MRTNVLLPLRSFVPVLCVVLLGCLWVPSSSLADQVIADDLIVQMSECVGMDCVNGESFGFDTIRLKENNTRIKFEDTSVGTFPSTDWQLTANDSASGGANKFSIEDITNAKVPFTIIGNAPTNSLYVDSTGRVGLRTSTPVLDVHLATGNTPAMRLEQNNSGGFTAQTWDVAGNEAGFFIRDVTNGSQLAFRILPGADSSSLVIAADNDIGIGTLSPGTLEDGSDASVHIQRTDGDASMLIEEASTTVASRDLLELRNKGNPRFVLRDTNANAFWRYSVENNANNFIISRSGTGVSEFTLTNTGNLTIQGNYFAQGGTQLNVPDYVFEPDYELMPLKKLSQFVEKEKHLPKIPTSSEIKKNGLNMTEMQLRLLEKVEELTLYTIQQEKTIDQLAQDNVMLKARLEALEKQYR